MEVELEFFNYLKFISIAQFGRFYVSFKYSDFITNYNKIPKNIFKYFFAFSDSEGLPLHFCKKDLVSIFKIEWVMTLQRLVRNDNFLESYRSWQLSPIYKHVQSTNSWRTNAFFILFVYCTFGLHLPGLDLQKSGHLVSIFEEP